MLFFFRIADMLISAPEREKREYVSRCRKEDQYSLYYILNILKQYSDEDHPMTQQQIADRLLSDYDMPVDRRTVKSNVMDLIEKLGDLAGPDQCPAGSD